ncbi:MAG: hypothetical protein WBR18_11240 [Anaerolineales bacterium]
MTSNQAIQRDGGQSVSKLLLAGGLIGAVTGMGVAYLLAQRAERQGGEMQLSSGEGLRLGLLVLGLLRQVADLATPDEDA